MCSSFIVIGECFYCDETLIEDRLSTLAGVDSLEFNLINRTLGVWHRLPSTTPIETAIKALGMQAEPLTGKPTPAADLVRTSPVPVVVTDHV